MVNSFLGGSPPPAGLSLDAAAASYSAMVNSFLGGSPPPAGLSLDAAAASYSAIVNSFGAFSPKISPGSFPFPGPPISSIIDKSILSSLP